MIRVLLDLKLISIICGGSQVKKERKYILDNIKECMLLYAISLCALWQAFFWTTNYFPNKNVET